MDMTLFKQIKKGDQIDLGQLMPGVDDTEVQWTCTNVLDDCVRETDSGTQKFRMADFDLNYCGVSLGSIRAYEQKDGTISWEAAK